MIRNKTHTAELIKEKNNIEMYEITNDDTGKSCGFFVVRWDDFHGQVTSAVPGDFPDSGTWISGGRSAGSISYVANGRSRATAQRWFKKLSNR